MRYILSIVIFILAGFSIQGQSVLDKRIDFSADSISISDALLQLSNDHNINILFSSAFFNSGKRITLRLTNQKTSSVLHKILHKTNVVFKENHGSILLINKERFNIFGYIKDKESGEVLPGASVVDLLSGNGVTANGYGYYCVDLHKGKSKLQFSYVGYKTISKTFDATKNTNLNIDLSPSNYLKDVVILSSINSKSSQESSNQNSIFIKKINTFSVPGGEPDILRQLNLLPGVQNGTDGFGGLHIRGGNADQNLILLDDVPVFNPSHSIGLFSIFNTSIIKSAVLTKGGFPARYGGRLSSVLEVRTKEGNILKPSATIGLSFIATTATIETPVIKNKLSVLLSARRSHVDNYLRKISEKNKKNENKNGQTDYHFIDYNAKINFKLSHKDRFYLSYYSGHDSFEDITHSQSKPKEVYSTIKDSILYNYKWGNKIASLRWNHLFNNKLFSNSSFIYSNFKYGNNIINKNSKYLKEKKIEESIDSTLFNSEIEELSFRTDFDYFFNSDHRLKTGLGLTKRRFVPSILKINETINLVDSSNIFKTPIALKKINYSGIEYYGYLSDQFTIGKLQFNTGIRVSKFTISNKSNYSFQPRFTAKYYKKSNTFSFSISKMNQFLHLLSTTDAGLPSDLWVPATSKVKPESAWISTIGYQHKFAKEWVLNTEIYYKTMHGLQFYIDSIFNQANQEINVDSWEDIINTGSGKSMGWEVLLEKYSGKLTGWISYTLSKSTRTVLNQETPYKYSSLHNFHIQLAYMISNNINLNLSWSYQSGLPADQHKQSQNNFLFADLFDKSSVDIKNNRLPAYHKLDIGISMGIMHKNFSHHLSIGLYNAYNRKNTLLIYRKNDNSNEWVKINSLPLIPSFRYVISFN